MNQEGADQPVQQGATEQGVILFVDDNADTVQDHRDCLETETGFSTLLRESIDSAVRYLHAHHGRIRLVVIDIYIPNNYGLLIGNAEKVPAELRSAQGGLLGVHLKEKYPKIPFVYLAANPNAYPNLSAQTKSILFAKNYDDLGRFKTECARMMREIDLEGESS